SVSFSTSPSPLYLYSVACPSGSVILIGRPRWSRSVLVVNFASSPGLTCPRGLTVAIACESSLYSQVRLSPSGSTSAVRSPLVSYSYFQVCSSGFVTLSSSPCVPYLYLVICVLPPGAGRSTVSGLPWLSRLIVVISPLGVVLEITSCAALYS